MDETFLKSLQARRKVLIIGYGATVCAYVACILLLLVSSIASIVLVNITTLFYIFVMRRLDKQYNREFAKANLLLSNGALLSNTHVNYKNGRSPEEIKALRLLPVAENHKSSLCGISLQGSYGNTQIFAGEFTSYHMLQNAAKKIGLLSGILIDFTLLTPVTKPFALVHSTAMNADVQSKYYNENGFIIVPSPQNHSGEAFTLYVKDVQDIYSVNHCLKHAEELIQATEKVGTQLILIANGKHISAFFNKRNIIFTTPIFTPPTIDILTWDYLPELSLMLKFLERLT